LDRLCFLSDADLELIGKRRTDYSKLGFGLQLVTVRMLGTFPSDPLDVPAVMLDYVAGQIGVADPSCLKRYTERRTTRFEHQAEIAAVDSWLDFAAAQEDLTAWIGDRAWTTGDGPTALFDAAVAWLRQRRVLLPGVSTLARLVARVRDEATTRLYETLAGLLIGQQARLLEQLLDVEPGERTSRLDAWRRADDEVYRLCRLFGERLSRRVVGLLAPVWSTIGVCAMRCCCNKFVSCARGAPRRKRSPGRWACRQPRSPRWFG